MVNRRLRGTPPVRRCRRAGGCVAVRVGIEGLSRWIAAVAVVAASPMSLGAGCSEITDDAKRLECYDAQRKSRATDAAQQGTAAQGPFLPRVRRTHSAWIRHIRAAPVTGQTTVVVSTRAAERVACEAFGDASEGERAKLVIRCKDNNTALLLENGCMDDKADPQAVIWRVDDGPEQRLAMTAGAGDTALGLWRGHESIPIVKQLFGARRVRVELAPQGGGEGGPALLFPVYNLDAAIGPLRRACGW